ncbi:hypothetical protein EDB89DRAFT_2168017 [Lactarius sanguifluus]|nr:hypothetical protein EDB89DRAFT_2168017 [Lactarius sanguifluus]
MDEGLVEVVLDVESWMNWMRSVGRGQHPIKLKQISLTEELEIEDKDDELEAIKLESEETCGEGVGEGEGLGYGVEEVTYSQQDNMRPSWDHREWPRRRRHHHDLLQRGKVEVKRGVVFPGETPAVVDITEAAARVGPQLCHCPSTPSAPCANAGRKRCQRGDDDNGRNGPSWADAAPMVTVTATIVSYSTSTSTSAAPDLTSLAPAKGPASSTPTSVTMIDITSPSSDTRDCDHGQPPSGDTSAYGEDNALLPVQGLPFPWPIRFELPFTREVAIEAVNHGLGVVLRRRRGESSDDDGDNGAATTSMMGSGATIRQQQQRQQYGAAQ